MKKSKQHLLKKKYQIAIRRFYYMNFTSKKIDELTSSSKDNFKAHINRFLLPKMTNENFGKIWSLDHIVPVELFDLDNEIEIKVCYHYINYMPMFNEDNRIKGCSIHFSKEKMQSLLLQETDEKVKSIIKKLIVKCDEEIENRYRKYL